MIAPTRSVTKRQLPTRRELTRRRKALGWSLTTLAERAGKDRTYVGRVFSGYYWPAPTVYLALVEAVEQGEREVSEQRKRA